LLDVTVFFAFDQVQDERITQGGKDFPRLAMYIIMLTLLPIHQALKGLAMPFWKPFIIAAQFWSTIIPSTK
jgi:hypothetical protein